MTESGEIQNYSASRNSCQLLLVHAEWSLRCFTVHCFATNANLCVDTASPLLPLGKQRMSAVIEAIVFVVKQTFNIIADIFCLVLLAVSLVGVWRWPFLLEGRHSSSVRVNIRLIGLFNFLAVVLDLVCVVPLVQVICSWRCLRLIADIRASANVDFYTLRRRGLVLYHYAILICLDTPTLLAAIFVHVTFWRIPGFYAKLRRERGKAAFPLCSCAPSGDFDDTDYRKIVWESALASLLDLFVIPFGALVVVTGYRIPYLLARLANDGDDLLKSELSVIVTGCTVLVEIPFGVMLVVTVLMGFRARVLLVEFAAAESAVERYAIIARHFLFSLRDWAVAPLFLPLLASLYRGWMCSKAILDDVTPWADPSPKITVAKATLELPPRGTGLVLRVEGTKDSGFSVRNGESIRLFVRNRSLWDEVAAGCGASAAAVARSMLPLQLNPKYFRPSELSADKTEVSLVFDFDEAIKHRTIRKNCGKIASAVEIQVEYGRHDGTLFCINVDLAKFGEYVDDGMEIPVLDLGAFHSSEEFRGDFFCDVFWRHVVVQFGLLLFDLVGLVFFVLLHLFPHRAWRMYVRALESPLSRDLREKAEDLRKLLAQLAKAEAACQRIGSAIEVGIRQTPPSVDGTASACSVLAEVDSLRSSAATGKAPTEALKATDEYRAAICATLKRAHEMYSRHFDDEHLGLIFGSILLVEDEGALKLPRRYQPTYESDLQRALVASLKSAHADHSGESPLLADAPGAQESDGRRQSLGGNSFRDESISLDRVSSTVIEAVNVLPAAESSPAGPLHINTCLEHIHSSYGSTVSTIEAFIATAESEMRLHSACQGRFDWVRTRLIAVEEVGQLALDFFAVLCAAVALLSVYRTYTTVRAFRDGEPGKWRQVALHCVLDTAEAHQLPQ